ncbi:hypothetical protein EG329_008098 [Mollisiaceae sp. DMI_Dod_QoI]|nr:hypothetical protein EG329_008098 [Helotiales sp. DMI_Dod_QoI]
MGTTPLTAADVRQLIGIICDNDINVFTNEYYDLYQGIRDGVTGRLIMPSELGLSDRLVTGINSASKNRHLNIGASDSFEVRTSRYMDMISPSTINLQMDRQIPSSYKPNAQVIWTTLPAESKLLVPISGPCGGNTQRRLLSDCVTTFHPTQAGDTVAGGYVVYSKGATFFTNIVEVVNCEANNAGWFTNGGDIDKNKAISNNLFDTLPGLGGHDYRDSTPGTHGLARVF